MSTSQELVAMASDCRDALREAAKEDDMEWPELKGFLKGRKIDVGMFDRDHWLKLLENHRQYQGDLPRERSSPRGSSDAISLSDSAIDITDEAIVYAIGDNYRCQKYPDGKIPLMSWFSDETDEHYIIETIRERLGLEKDRSGMVNFTCVENGSKKTFEVHCCVRSDDDGEADIVFSTKLIEKKKEERARSATKSARDGSGSRNSSNDTADSGGNEDLNSKLAIAYMLCDPRVHNLETEKVMDITRTMKACFSVLRDDS